MPDRRPVWLTEDEREQLRKRATHMSPEYQALIARTEPWLTVDDNGRAVRMAATGVIEACTGEFYENQTADDPTGEALYRAVPVDQDGGE